MNKPSVIINNTGSRLYEGRSRGIACAFVKKTGDDTFEMVQPFSPCKDYLNDQLYSSITGKPYDACGLQTVKEPILGDCSYIAFCDRQHDCCGDATKFIHESSKIIPSDWTNTLKVMHEIEDKFGIKGKTEIIPVEKNLFIAKIAPEWVGSTWMVSLWSLLIRNAIYATGEGDAVTELAKTNDRGDRHSLKSLLLAIELIAKNGIPKQDFDRDGMSHGAGIMSWLARQKQ